MRNSSIVPFKNDESWVILSPIEQSIKRKIESVGTPLKDWDISINYGIKTGFNDAFVISGEKRDEILRKCKSDDERERTAELIRPILRGRDIKRYGYVNNDLWLLFIPWHFPLQNDTSIKGASNIAEQCFREQYPAVYSHLLGYKSELSNRNKAETGIRYEWYALQRWGANYWEDFSKQKIIFQEMVNEPSFAYDKDIHFFGLDTTRIIVGDNLLYLLAIMNSKLFFYSIKRFYGGGGLGESGIRMKHTFFQKFPCIIPTKNDSTYLSSMAYDASMSSNMDEKSRLENIIDQKIFESYGLSNDEIDWIVNCK